MATDLYVDDRTKLDNGRCDLCEISARHLTCDSCGAEGFVIDCGHMAQPRPLAGDGHRVTCDDCAAE